MKKILLLAFTATMMLSACKKDKGGDEVETIPTCAIVKTVERWNNTEYIGTDVFKFDEQGRVIDDGWATYEYYTDRIITTDSDSDPADPRITTHTLDAQGRIIKQEGYYGNSTYEYNNDGYLIKANGTTFTWESGNLVKAVEVFGSTSYITNITYGNDIITDKLVAGFIFGGIYANEWYLLDYFGKQPKNAPIIEQRGTTTDTYSYMKDNKGKINGYKVTKDGESTPHWEYTVDYNCK